MSSQEPAGEAGAVLRFAIVIEKARNNYSAYVPDLPDCVATGDSVEETNSLIREAIAFHLEGMREDRLPIPVARTWVAWVEVDGARKPGKDRMSGDGGAGAP